MQDCIFCKIANKEIPTNFLYETDKFVVFKDIHPKAPIHLLIVSKDHIEDMRSAPAEILSEVQKIALKLEEENNLNGFVLGTNTGDKALVKHMHFHFLDKAPKKAL